MKTIFMCYACKLNTFKTNFKLPLFTKNILYINVNILWFYFDYFEWSHIFIIFSSFMLLSLYSITFRYFSLIRSSLRRQHHRFSKDGRCSPARHKTRVPMADERSRCTDGFRSRLPHVDVPFSSSWRNWITRWVTRTFDCVQER